MSLYKFTHIPLLKKCPIKTQKVINKKKTKKKESPKFIKN